MHLRRLCALALALVASCSDDAGREIAGSFQPTLDGLESGEDTGDGEDDGELFDLGTPDPSGGGGSPEGGACECAPKSDLVYLLSDAGELWLFDPPSREYTKLGSFDCGAELTTFSMGVGRDGKAWIMFRPDGRIGLVDVNAANACEMTAYDPYQFGFHLFGMAFASSGPNDPCDHLYLHSFDDVEWSEGQGIGMLGRVDRTTLDVAPVSPIDYNGGELTGTGDGRLFAFAGIPDAELVEYDKATGDVVDVVPLGGLQLTYAFAFAFWGGDFWFFTESGGLGSPSKVTVLDHDGDLSLVTLPENAPMRVVGAGVSTCAPLVPQG